MRETVLRINVIITGCGRARPLRTMRDRVYYDTRYRELHALKIRILHFMFCEVRIFSSVGKCTQWVCDTRPENRERNSLRDGFMY